MKIGHKNFDLNQQAKEKRNRTNKEVKLSAETIHKIIARLLDDAKVPQQTLAEALSVTIEQLLRLYAKQSQEVLIEQISLPLVKLYCSTKFINHNHK